MKNHEISDIFGEFLTFSVVSGQFGSVRVVRHSAGSNKTRILVINPDIHGFV